MSPRLYAAASDGSTASAAQARTRAAIGRRVQDKGAHELCKETSEGGALTQGGPKRAGCVPERGIEYKLREKYHTGETLRVVSIRLALAHLPQAEGLHRAVPRFVSPRRLAHALSS